MKKIFLSIALLCTSSVSVAQDCLFCDIKENVIHYSEKILQDYNEYTCSPSLIPFELKSSFTYEQRCQLISDLRELKNLSLSNYGVRFQEVFGPQKSPQYAGEEIYNWIIHRIKRLYLINSSVSTAINYGLCAETEICDSKYKRGDIGLDDSYFNKSTPLERIKVLIHEARHTDGHDFILGESISNLNSDTLHIDCNRNNISMGTALEAYQGKTCDQDTQGGIGVSLVFLGNLINYGIDLNGIVNFNSQELNEFYIKNLYNNELSSINEINFNISKIID